ncbi:MAG TPA: LLM class flavin-dependent oxidoreductase [Acidimicrobiales bacterium]|nr:LLM class flavin-dependent oxidoreductase [Acidimicrobiales bacterium]
MTAPGPGPVWPQVGLGFQADKRPADYQRLAAGAEHYGFDVVSVYGDLYYQPPLPALLAMAAATSAITLGPACLNPYTLHPVEIAGQIAALDAASGGRAFLGLARGSWLGDLGVDQRHAPETVAEAAAIVAALLKGDRAGVTGPHFVLPPGAALRQRPLRSSVPLLIGTWGPRLAHIAGRIADEVKIGGTANADLVPVVRGWADEGATSSGRAENRAGIVVGAVTVVDEDGPLARAKARQEVVMYLDVVGALDPTFEFPKGLLDQIRHELRASGTAAAARLIPDEVLDRFAFAGTPGAVAGHAVAVLQAGAARVEFGTPHGMSDDRGLELLGAMVLPAVREARAGR